MINIYNESRGLRRLIRWLCSVSFSIFLLYGIPLSFYPPRLALQKSLHLKRTFEEVFVGWSTLLAIDPLYVSLVSSIVGFLLARSCHMNLMDQDRILPNISKGSDIIMKQKMKTFDILRRPNVKKILCILGTALPIAAVIGIQSNLHMMYPSWIWNPLLLHYNVYWPSQISSAMDGLCLQEYLTYEKDEATIEENMTLQSFNPRRYLKKDIDIDPLCLSKKNWNELSTDALSSENVDDVKNVLMGIKYLRNQSGGIIFAVMSRDTINAIKPLRDNVESLLPFTSNLAVVVFENDSEDGSRRAFLEWSIDVKDDYIVDVIECEDSPGCKFKETHRDLKKGIPYEQTSAIGRMAEFRQRVVDHILNDTRYVDYSHFLVLDIDLSVSISPLGILHSLGVKPGDAVASSGRQARPGSFGSLQPPYDFSAFVAHQTEENRRMTYLNDKFCALRPEGYRWRNECRAVSVGQFMMIQAGDKLNHGKPYHVASAFNGAVLYPIQLIRESKAKYDGGSDGQRCEHIGFNLSMKKPMYINPKWNMHLHPHLMGGPSGERAMRTLQGIRSSPTILPVILGQTFASVIVFTYCMITLTMLIVYPLWVCISRPIIGRPDIIRLTKASIQERSKSPSIREMEFLLDPVQNFPSRKRKDSEFDQDLCNQEV